MRRIAAALLVSTALFAAQANEPPPPPVTTPPAPAQLPPGASAEAAGLVAWLGLMLNVDVTYGAEITDKPGVAGLLDVTATERLPAGSTRSPFKFTIARVEATGFDAAAAAGLAAEGDTSGQPLQKIADRIDMFDMAVSGEFIVLRVASQTIEGLEMKPVGFRMQLPEPATQQTPEQALAALGGIVKLLGHAVDSMRAARASAENMTFEVDLGAMSKAMAANNPAMANAYPEGSKITYTIASLSQGEFDRGRLGRGEMKGVAATMIAPPLGEITMTMRETWFDGIDVSKVVPNLIAAEWPPITRDPLLTYGAGCSYDIVVRVPRIGEFAVPEFCIDPIAFTYVIPKAFDFTLKGVFTPVPAAEFAAPPYVAKYFTHPLDFSFGYGATYDPDSGVASLTHYGFRLAEFGSIDFRAAGGGLQLEALPMLPTTYMQTLSLVSGEVEMVDEGGVAKLLDISATMQTEAAGEGGAAVTPEALKMQAVMGVNMLVGMLGNTPEAAAMGESIRNFLDKGGKLAVGVKPAQPMVSADFTALAAKPPAEISRTLGAYATWTAP